MGNSAKPLLPPRALLAGLIVAFLAWIPRAGEAAGEAPGTSIAGAGEAQQIAVGGTALADEGSGVGGSGPGGEESGVGGTGIFGTIVAFGSVWINGLRVHFEPTARVEIDGIAATPEALAIGQLAWVEARESQGRLVAEALSVFHAVTGPIHRIDPRAGRIEVLGQEVDASATTVLFDRRAGRSGVLEDFEPGDFLRVSGVPRGDGRVMASRVERDAPGRTRLLTPAPEPGVRSWSVGNLRIVLTPTVQLLDGPRGRPLVIEGRWNPERQTLEGAGVREVFDIALPLQRLSLEGYVQERMGSDHFRIHGFEVDASAVSESFPAVELDRRIWVSGRLRAARRVWVERISVEPPRPARDPDPTGAAE